MKDKIRTISHILESLEEFSEIHFSWHFVDMTMIDAVARFQSDHNSSEFCRKVKLYPCKLLKNCLQEHHGSCFIRALNERKPFILRCHAGALEIATPLFSDDRFIGILYAGIFRDPQATTYPEVQKEYSQLKTMSETKLLQLGDFLNRLCHRIIGNSGHEEEKSPLLPAIKGHDERIYQAAAYMRRHSKEKISAKEVAQSVGLSPSRLTHLFSQEMPFPFAEWLQRLRVSEAVRLIEGTGLPFTAIAELCGFADHSRMSLLVRRYLQATPSQLRNQYQHLADR